jgi:patatin-related protein
MEATPVADEGEGIELRLALAMRGGVSLAVWIGGACGEIDQLRRADEGSFWRRLRELAGYKSVAVDVMAGASAGGLNAVIYTASQVYGFGLHELKQIWLDIGRLDQMLRSGTGDTPSILKGDEFFLVKAQAALAGLIEGRTPAAGDLRVDTTLSTTLVEPIRAQAAGRVGQETEHQRFTSSFRFRHLGDSEWMSDFVGSDRQDQIPWRLAVAARATAAYPVAFEGALVYSARPGSFAHAAQPAAVGPDIDMNGVFGEATDTGRPFATMDGGVLDNIPLARAIESIAEASSDGRTRRVLVYVRPGGPGEAPAPDLPPPRISKVRSTQGVLQALVGSRVGSETITDDLRALEEHNRRIARARRLRRVRFAAISSRRDLCRAAAKARDTYLVERSDADAQQTRRLLEDPIARLGGDPFPVPPSAFPQVAWRAPLLQWSEPERIGLDAALADAYANRLQGQDVLMAGIGAVNRVAILLRELADEILEHGGDPESCQLAGEVKERLYRLRFVTRELIDRPRRLGMVAMAVADAPSAEGTSMPSVDGWAKRALEVVDDFFFLSSNQVAVVGRWIRKGGSETALQGVRAKQLTRLDRLLAGKSTSGTEDVRFTLIDDLVACARLLTGDGVKLSPHPKEHATCALYLHDCLGDREPGREELQALEIVTFSESVVGEPGLRPISFVEMSSTARTPIAGLFPRLLDDFPPIRRGVDASIERLAAGKTDSVPVTTKLAGNVVANFGAFLKDTWRENDWLWGQLDAVPALVDVLVTPERLVDRATQLLAAGSPEATKAALLGELEGIVVGIDSGDSPQCSTSAFMKQAIWMPRLDRITTAVFEAVNLAATGTPAPGTDMAGLDAVRDALVARRQWEVVAAHISQSGSAAPADVVKWADPYWVGLETIKDIDEESRKKTLEGLVLAGWGLANSNLRRLRGLSVLQKAANIVWWSTTTKSWKLWASVTGLALLSVLAFAVGPFIDADATGTRRWAAVAGGPGAVAFVFGVIAGLLNRGVAATFGILGGVAMVVTSVCVGRASAAPMVVGGLALGGAAMLLLAMGLIRSKLR